MADTVQTIEYLARGMQVAAQYTETGANRCYISSS